MVYRWIIFKLIQKVGGIKIATCLKLNEVEANIISLKSEVHSCGIATEKALYWGSTNLASLSNGYRSHFPEWIESFQYHYLGLYR